MDFDRLFNIEFKDLDKTRVSILLWTLQVEALIELNFGEQVIDIFGLVVKLVCIPLAEDTILIVHHFLPLVEQ